MMSGGRPVAVESRAALVSTTMEGAMLMFEGKRRWRRQPAPVLDTAAEALAALLAESGSKRDDRRG